MTKKSEKYDEFQRSRGPKEVQFDDDFESELMSQKIRKDMSGTKDNKLLSPEEHKTESIQVINETPKQFRLLFDLKRNNNNNNETKVKHNGSQPLIENKNNNKFNVNHNFIYNNINHNYNASGNSIISYAEPLTRQPRLQRLPPQKYYKINAHKIVDLNPLVKYFKTLDSSLHLEPVPLFSVNYSHKTGEQSRSKQQVPVAKSVPVMTTPASVFYSYRHNTESLRKVTTTPMPLNVTQYRKAQPPSPTLTTYLRQTTEKMANLRSIDLNPLKILPTITSAARPVSHSSTPDPFVSATKCVEKSCRLPDCFCGGTETPGTFLKSTLLSYLIFI